MLNPSFMLASSQSTLFHQHAAVDVEALAVDEAGGVREQEQDGVRDLFRLAEAAHRDAAGDHRALLRRERRMHRRVARAGLTQLTRIPVPATARAKPFVMVTTAPLLEA